ncbi:MAG: hypothetical protein R3A45_11420 [Bdellovibrionota bacterium]
MLKISYTQRTKRYDIDTIEYEAIKPLVNTLMSPASDFDFAYQTYYYNFPYRNHFMAENMVNAMRVVENHTTLCDATVHAFVGRQHMDHMIQLLCLSKETVHQKLWIALNYNTIKSAALCTRTNIEHYGSGTVTGLVS